MKWWQWKTWLSVFSIPVERWEDEQIRVLVDDLDGPLYCDHCQRWRKAVVVFRSLRGGQSCICSDCIQDAAAMLRNRSVIS